MTEATPTLSTEAIAALSVNGRLKARGTFPAMKLLEREYKKQGYRTTHVGYAPHFKGICYCKGCQAQITNPYVNQYEGHQYFTCKNCSTINYVN